MKRPKLFGRRAKLRRVLAERARPNGRSCFRGEAMSAAKYEQSPLTENYISQIISMDVHRSLEWLEEHNKQLNTKEYADGEAKVTRIFAIMKKFDNNDTIVDEGCYLLNRMTAHSEFAVHCISSTSGAIKRLMKKVTKDLREGRTRPTICHVLLRISECSDTGKLLLKSECLPVFLEALGEVCSPIYDSSFLILVHLLDFPKECFPKDISKESIETTILSSLEEISKSPHTFNVSGNYSWYLDRIVSGTKTQRYCCAYAAAYSIPWGEDYRAAGARPLLKRALSDPNIDPFVREIADKAYNDGMFCKKITHSKLFTYDRFN